jgi:hypothetical protein
MGTSLRVSRFSCRSSEGGVKVLTVTLQIHDFSALPARTSPNALRTRDLASRRLFRPDRRPLDGPEAQWEDGHYRHGHRYPGEQRFVSVALATTEFTFLFLARRLVCSWRLNGL